MHQQVLEKENWVKALDPRMKLLLVITVGTATMLAPNRYIVFWNYIVIMGLWLVIGEWKRTIKYTVLFMGILLVQEAIAYIENDTFRLMIGMVVFMVARSMAAFIMAIWMSIGLRIGDLIIAFQNMCMPKGCTITFAVIFRYIPTVKEEFHNIRNTMKLRDIDLDLKHFFTHPIRTLEYALIPLILRSIKVADELAASAMTRGLDLETRRTSYREVKLKPRDVLITLFIILLLMGGGTITTLMQKGGIL